ncbi:MAG: hypothetical protein PHV10_00960 [Sulfuricurvum sp.]|nr:hypothetical protein [Sulfuricurvum sp.]
MINKFNILKILVETVFLILLLVFIIDNVKMYSASDIVTPGAGASDAIPHQVYELNKFIIRLNLNDFALEGKLKSDSLLFQRSIEYIYPYKYEEKSKNIFILNDDRLIQEDCMKIDSYEGIDYYECK